MIDQLSSLLSADISQALGWTIIHSLWQVSLFALIMSGLHRLYHHRSSVVKYNISLYTLCVSVVASLITFCIYYIDNTGHTSITAIMDTTLSPVYTNVHPTNILSQITTFLSENIQHVNTIWIIGIGIFTIKFIVSFGYIKYIKRSSVPISETSVSDLIFGIGDNIGLSKKVSILESAKINVPMVIGYMKPVILFPVGMVNMLTIQEIEAIIAHELFHIKRNDYIINLLTTIVEIAYFFHPAMWWISANIKAERENCCDDAAINYNIDSMTYAKALVKLEEMRKGGIPALAMPFASNKHQLLNRIKRILNMEQTKNDIREKSVATILLLFMAVLFSTNLTSQPELDTEVPVDEVTNIDFTEELETQNSERPDIPPTLLKGKEEIEVQIEEGVFSSLTVDGQEITDGDMVHTLKEVFSEEKLNDNNRYTQRFYMKGNPSLEWINSSYMLHGDESFIEFEDDRFPALDTLPHQTKIGQSKATIITDIDKEKVEVEMDNGEIKSLKIDGKEIPKSQYHQYQNKIDHIKKNYSFDLDRRFNDFDFDSHFNSNRIDSIFSKSYGMIFVGNDWREFGGNIQQLLDEDVLEKMQRIEEMEFFELDDFENMERFKGLEKLHDLKSLKNLEGLKHLEELEGLENLSGLMEELGIQMDSSIQLFKWNSEGMEDFPQLNGRDIFEGFEFFDDDNMIIRRDNNSSNSGTVVDKLGNALNKDGLLREYKSNKIELSGKHLKINGEKMPKALFNKYKNMYQEETGAPLTKKSKMIFDVEGKPSKRKVRTF